MGMVRDTHPDHDFYQLFSEPCDFGFGGVARLRTWTIGAHNQRTTVLHDPFELMDSISASCQSHQTSIQDYLVASKAEITMEAIELAQRRGIPFRHSSSDFGYLLTQREMETKIDLDVKYARRTGQQASENNEGLIYFLGDSSTYGNSWSACSHKIPTFRLNSKSGIYWIPREKRFMTAKERLISMGWPCCSELSESLGIPLFGASDTKRAADLIGNAMHWQTAGIAQLIALTCFGPAQ